MGPAIEFRDVSKRFGDTQALDGTSFGVARGETVALLGPNGAGKSTAVNILLGLRRADAGTIEVLGTEPNAAVTGGSVGAMLQTSGLPDGITVREVVGLARSLSPHPADLDATLQRAGLADIAGQRVEGLSGGQTKRVLYAFAIAGRPELLFLDEPTAAMDVESRRAFWADLRDEAAAGTTVLFATHYLEEAEAVADRIVVLHRGRVVADGTAASLKAGIADRTLRFTTDAGLDGLRALPGVVTAERRGEVVELRSHDADATVVALVQAGIGFRDLEVAGVAFEDAFLALTAEDSTS